MQRYLAISLLTCALCLATVAGAAIVVDPYGLHGWIAVDGLNRLKPASYIQVDAAKARRFARATPTTVVLGNSRVDIGFDPASPAWPDRYRPVLNFGIPGGGFPDVVRSYLLARDRGVKRMAIGLDFADFVSAEPPIGLQQYQPLATELSPALLVRTHLSLRAVLDTLRTILAQRDPYAETMTAAGFNPLRQYVPIIRREGHAAVAEQRNRENVAAYLRRDWTLVTPEGRPNRPMAELAELLADAGQAGIEIHLFTFPYHADLLQTLNQLGLWPLVEDWKRRLQRLATAPGTRVAGLWDFAIYSAYTTERIPLPGDTASDMAWYWEPGHFKSALGDRLIATMFAARDGIVPVAASDSEPTGIDLMATDIEDALMAVRQTELAYELAHPAEVERIRELIDGHQRTINVAGD